MNDTTDVSPQTLRAEMVDRIAAAGWAHADRVADAMRTVPRHLFVPDAPSRTPTPTGPSSPNATPPVRR